MARGRRAVPEGLPCCVVASASQAPSAVALGNWTSDEEQALVEFIMLTTTGVFG